MAIKTIVRKATPKELEEARKRQEKKEQKHGNPVQIDNNAPEE